MTNHKKIYGGILVCFCVSLLAGCGKEAQRARWREGYVAIQMEEQALSIPQKEETGKNCLVLSRQFFHGEAVQICALEKGGSLEIGLYREDGGWETLLADASLEYKNRWYLGERGVWYILAGETVICLEEGKETRRWEAGAKVMSICELSEGQVVALLYEKDKGAWLASPDSATGKMARWGKTELSDTPNQVLGSEEGCVLVMDESGVWKAAETWGTAGQEGNREYLMPFGTAYKPGYGVEDFQAQEDGKIEVLQKSGVLQKLELRNPEQVVVARMWSGNSWIRECTVRFNRENGTYCVILEESEDPKDWYALGEYKSRTAVGMATGTGADIIFSDAVANVDELMETGALEDLKPYMERDGIQEEEYFPAAFGSWRREGRIYGANVAEDIAGLWIREEVFGGKEPGIETLVDAMLAYEGEKAVFRQYWDGQYILEYFLSGSKDLWGMVDWEEGSCDFEGGLFARMLEAAKRYADDETGTYPVLAEDLLYLSDIYNYSAKMSSARMAAEGKLPVGYFFDDGCHMLVAEGNSRIMCISATAANKEGAWAFIRYMLSEEAQLDYKNNIGYPVHRGAFDQVMARIMEQGPIVENPNGKGITYYGDGTYREMGREAYIALFTPTKEAVEEIRTMLEEAKPMPLRTAPLVRIILEETEAYFVGDKKEEEVIRAVENRVRLYLDEHGN